MTVGLDAANDERNPLSRTDHLELIRRSVPMFANRTLVASLVVREPFVIYNEPEELKNASVGEKLLAESDIENYSGVAIEVVKRFGSIFKLKIRCKRPRDNQFGVFSISRNEWTGLMGDLVRREADIAVTALSITLSRARVIDYTRAYYVETVAILLPRPEEVENYFAIFEPFSASLWLVLLGTIMLLIILVTIMTKLEDKQLEQEERANALQVGLVRLASDGQQQIGLSQELQLKAHNSHPYEQAFGSSWLDRFYYAVTCVINILLIRGEFFHLYNLMSISFASTEEAAAPIVSAASDM